MIGLIFSYVKSAVVLVCMTCVCAAGIVCVCLFTPTTFDLVVRIVGLCVLQIASYAAAAVFALRLLSAQIDDGNERCAQEALGERLRKLARRTYFKSVRASILLKYAYTLIYRGAYEKAMENVSNAVIAGGDRIKGEAAVCFCEIFYMRNDARYFAHYFDRAVDALHARNKCKDAAVRAEAGAQLAALRAMRLHIEGDAAGALARLRDFDPDGVKKQHRQNLAALADRIARNATEDTAEE